MLIEVELKKKGERKKDCGTQETKGGGKKRRTQEQRRTEETGEKVSNGDSFRPKK